MAFAPKTHTGLLLIVRPCTSLFFAALPLQLLFGDDLGLLQLLSGRPNFFLHNDLVEVEGLVQDVELEGFEQNEVGQLKFGDDFLVPFRVEPLLQHRQTGAFPLDLDSAQLKDECVVQAVVFIALVCSAFVFAEGKQSFENELLVLQHLIIVIVIVVIVLWAGRFIVILVAVVD